MKFVGLIPARGGSKGIRDKSIAPCAGKPLLYYTAQQAHRSRHLSRIILSTDSERIAAVGRALRLDVPFIRPAAIARDQTPMIEVLQQAIEWLEKAGENFDALVLLQPTSPLRQARHIDGAIDLFIKKQADTVVSVTEVPHQFNPLSLMRMKNLRLTPYSKGSIITRRQDKPLLYARNGPAVLIIRTKQIKRGILYGPTTYGYVMPADVSQDIDTPEDLARIDRLLRR